MDYRQRFIGTRVQLGHPAALNASLGTWVSGMAAPRTTQIERKNADTALPRANYRSAFAVHAGEVVLHVERDLFGVAGQLPRQLLGEHLRTLVNR